MIVHPTHDASRSSHRRLRMSRRVPNVGSWTLPLFETDAAVPVAPAPTGPPHVPEAEELALHLFWSMSVESFTLAHAAQRAEHPDERAALLALHREAEQLKELARALLAQVWRVRIGAASSAPVGAAARTPRSIAV